MNKKTVRDIDLKNKKVLVRCDFNVPLDENFNITDNRRIVGALWQTKGTSKKRILFSTSCKRII